MVLTGCANRNKFHPFGLECAVKWELPAVGNSGSNTDNWCPSNRNRRRQGNVQGGRAVVDLIVALNSVATREGTVTGHTSNNSIYGLRSTCLHLPLVWLAGWPGSPINTAIHWDCNWHRCSCCCYRWTNKYDFRWPLFWIPSPIPFPVQEVSVSVVRFPAWTEGRKIINSLILSTPHDLVVRLRSWVSVKFTGQCNT